MKIKKNHAMVMFVCMNEVNNYSIQHMNVREQQHLHTSVTLNRFWKSTNLNTKTIKIVT